MWLSFARAESMFRWKERPDREVCSNFTFGCTSKHAHGSNHLMSRKTTNRSRAVCFLLAVSLSLLQPSTVADNSLTAPLLLRTANLGPDFTCLYLNQLLLPSHHIRDENHQCVHTAHHGPASDLRTAAYQTSQHPLHSRTRSPYAGACQDFHLDYQTAAAVRIIASPPLRSIWLECSISYSYHPRLPRAGCG